MLAYIALWLWQAISFVCTVIGVLCLCLAGMCIGLGAGIYYLGDFFGDCVGEFLEWMPEYEWKLQCRAEGRVWRARSDAERAR